MDLSHNRKTIVIEARKCAKKNILKILKIHFESGKWSE